MTDNNPLTRDFQIKLAKLHRFADLVEDTFVGQAAALDSELSIRALTFAPEERDEFFEAHIDSYVELSDELPTILRYAVLTAADTGLEVHLNDTCALYAEVHKPRIELSDIKGAGMLRARDYLKKVAGVAFPDQGANWKAVVRLHDLRNSIVHADGFVPAGRKELIGWSRAIDGLRITDRGIITLSREFTPSATRAYDAFALELDSACEPLGLWRSVFPPVEE